MADVIWLASYPKSGNTWTRALLAGYFGEGAFDLNHLGADVALGGLRSLGDLLGVDPHLFHPHELLEYRPEAARQLARDVADRDVPAIHKLHSANHPTGRGTPVFPAGAGRALYVVRNPLDVAASWAPFFGVTLDQAVETLSDEGFVLNQLRGRFREILPETLLSWSGHVRSWLDAPGVPVHVLRYEDLQADAPAAFAEALRFIGHDPDPARVEAAVEAAQFDRLQAREAEEGFREHTPRARAPFFRKGKSGGWREELTPEQARRVVADHREVMQRLGYGDLVDEVGRRPVEAEGTGA
ncbi:sulfotransferase domain-containing protein [Rubrivirga sp.]|uniref:sulfotransferase domain-containing protein n=1 Tax=Rubrivirga sp. TaxID=1885344 RepID=UPI003B51CC2B